MNLRSRAKLAGKVAGLMRSQWWPDSRIKAYQSKKILAILTHCLDEIPYYRRNVSVGSGLSALDLLNAFPILEKTNLQDDAESFLWPSASLADLDHSRTSGSTGEPTTTFFDNDTWLLCKYALKARRVLNAAKPFAQRLLVVSEQSDLTHQTLSHISFADRFLVTKNLTVDDPIEENIQHLLNFRPTMIHGYPSYLAYLGESLLTSRPGLPAVPVIFTSSEVLTQPEREHLQVLYGGTVTDVYGSTEFKEIAVQCNEGRYHINFESVFVESLPDPDAGHPRILITTLVNKAMPLIRYDIGDHAELGHGPCPCGREGPYIRQPQGRIAELLRFPNGAAVTSFALTTAVGAFREIKNYTIVHDAPDSIRIRVFAQPQLDAKRRAALIEHVGRKLPSGIRIEVDPLKQRLPSGKRVAVSRAF